MALGSFQRGNLVGMDGHGLALSECAFLPRRVLVLSLAFSGPLWLCAQASLRGRFPCSDLPVRPSVLPVSLWAKIEAVQFGFIALY